MFKTVFLFVGAVIGAGFATGSEIMLYFDGYSLTTVMFSGIFMGLLALLYGIVGKMSKEYKAIQILQNILVFVATMIPYVVIIGGTEEIVYSCFGIPYAGVVTGVLVAILLLRDMRIIKLLNTLIVPVIIILMVILVSRAGGRSLPGTLGLPRGVMYAFMNMMLGGYIMSREGEKYTARQLCYIGVMISIVMTVLMCCCYIVSLEGVGFSMPLYEVARRMGLSESAGIIIYLAIFTTLIGSARVCTDMLLDIGVSKYLVVVFFALLACYAGDVEFARAVSQCYPAVGYMGILYSALVFVGAMLYMFKGRDKEESKRCISI